MRTLVLLLLLLKLTQVAADIPLQRLMNSTFEGYDKRTPPYAIRDGEILPEGECHLRVGIVLREVIVAEVMEEENAITLLPSVTMIWKDLTFSYHYFSKAPATDIFSSTAQVFPDGSVHLDLYQTVTNLCTFKFSLFPFDCQFIRTCYAMTAYSNSTVLIFEDLTTGTPGQQMRTNEWENVGPILVGNQRVQLENGYIQRVVYDFVIRRRPHFWVILVIVPVTLLMVVCLYGIFLGGPGDIRNASSIGSTTMTSLMVVVNLLAEQISRSEEVPALGLFAYYNIIITAAAVTSIVFLDWHAALEATANLCAKEPAKPLTTQNGTKVESRAKRAKSCTEYVFSEQTRSGGRYLFFGVSMLVVFINALWWKRVDAESLLSTGQ